MKKCLIFLNNLRDSLFGFFELNKQVLVINSTVVRCQIYCHFSSRNTHELLVGKHQSMEIGKFISFIPKQ